LFSEEQVCLIKKRQESWREVCSEANLSFEKLNANENRQWKLSFRQLEDGEKSTDGRKERIKEGIILGENTIR